jgi:hypothetical protein
MPSLCSYSFQCIWRSLPIDHFVVSFSENGDLLSQWRAYGWLGGGYSIGFHPSALFAAVRRHEDKPHTGCVLRKVKYQQNQKLEMIRKRIEICGQSWNLSRTSWSAITLDRSASFGLKPRQACIPRWP